METVQGWPVVPLLFLLLNLTKLLFLLVWYLKYVPGLEFGNLRRKLSADTAERHNNVNAINFIVFVNRISIL
jgi:hypothetical protein